MGGTLVIQQEADFAIGVLVEQNSARFLFTGSDGRNCLGTTETHVRTEPAGCPGLVGQPNPAAVRRLARAPAVARRLLDFRAGLEWAGLQRPVRGATQLNRPMPAHFRVVAIRS